MRKHVESETVDRSERRRTTVMLDPDLRKELQHILIDEGVTFSDWLNQKMADAVADTNRAAILAGKTQIDPSLVERSR